MGLAVKPREIIKFLESNGFVLKNTAGSHYKYQKGKFITVVPVHNADLDTGTLLSILRLSGLTKSQLKDWLGRK
ncbi:MAG: type II toxin-antitoxin system HicA family toxin [Oscillospiraceae bacterium]|nr:type II toxin-antitoxin system HicA family toxin [Oscillospiraceae bacterium]